MGGAYFRFSGGTERQFHTTGLQISNVVVHMPYLLRPIAYIYSPSLKKPTSRDKNQFSGHKKNVQKNQNSIYFVEILY